MPALAFGYLHLTYSAAGAVSGLGVLVGSLALGWLFNRTRDLSWPAILHLAVIGTIVVLAPVRLPGS